MTPKEKLEWMAKRQTEWDAHENKKIVQFHVAGPAHNQMIYVLLADGTLWKQSVLKMWEQITGP